MFSSLAKFWKFPIFLVHDQHDAWCHSRPSANTVEKQILLIVLSVFAVSTEVSRSIIWPVSVSAVVKGEGSSSTISSFSREGVQNPFLHLQLLAFVPFIYYVLSIQTPLVGIIAHRCLFYLYSLSAQIIF